MCNVKEMVDQSTLAELCERLHARAPVAPLIDTAQLIRDERDAEYGSGIKVELF